MKRWFQQQWWYIERPFPAGLILAYLLALAAPAALIVGGLVFAVRH